jgi:hypothetical protein
MRARALVRQVRDSHDAALQDTEPPGSGYAPRQVARGGTRAGHGDEDRQQAPGLGRELAAVAS